MSIASYRDLQVYRRSVEILPRVQMAIARFPGYEVRELGSQMRRASKGIPLNIAEGYGRRKSERDFKSFLGNAMGSANEMVVCFEICNVLGYVDASECEALMGLYEELGKMLGGLITKWR